MLSHQPSSKGKESCLSGVIVLKMPALHPALRGAGERQGGGRRKAVDPHDKQIPYL